MNRILEDVLKARQGHYTHALEVETVDQLETYLESLVEEFSKDYTDEGIVGFITSMQIYALDDKHEDAIYAFNVREYVDTLLMDCRHNEAPFKA